jgi:hypothetical protein
MGLPYKTSFLPFPSTSHIYKINICPTPPGAHCTNKQTQ